MWLYHVYSLESWDFLPDFGIVLQADADSHDDPADGIAATPGSDGADSKHWRAISQLQQITPPGHLVSQYIARCAGSPLNYNQLSHECRVDASGARAADDDAGAARGAQGARVLTTRTRGKRIPATTVLQQFEPGSVEDSVEDTFYGSEIVSWDRETNEIEQLYDMFDLASPETDMFPQGWSTLSGKGRRSTPISPPQSFENHARARRRRRRARAQASARAATRSTASTTTT